MSPYLIPPKAPCKTLGIGVFDGVHLGHQEIIRHCDTILSFHPLPNLVLNPNSDIQYITTPTERQHLVPSLIVLEFTKALATMSAATFLEEIIAPLAPETIIVGYDFKFGHKQEGNTDLLQAWCTQHNIAFKKVDPVKSDTDLIYKSSWVRKALRNDPDHAIELMGHPYIIIGEVIPGDNRGNKLGYPTANIKIDPLKVYPKPGVYKGQAIIQNQRYNAGVYIGQSKTFDKTNLSCEAHILEFNNDLYGQEICIEINAFIRNEHQFESEDALKAQIKEDLNTILG